jgi:hypothetical protein
MINWILTYNFLGYQASDTLEQEIFNKAKEIHIAYKIGNSTGPNAPIPYNKKIYSYPLEFLQQYFQDRVGNPQ